MIQNRTTTRFAVLMLMESRPFLVNFWPILVKKTIQVCISLPILYRALGDPCDPLQLTTLANKLCNYLINPIVYHSHLYGNLQSGPSKMSYFPHLWQFFYGFLQQSCLCQLFLEHLLRQDTTKGQLISKCSVGVFKLTQKTTKFL